MNDKRLTENGFERAADVVGCEPAMLKALCQKESPDGGFDPKGRLKIFSEKHKIYKYLPAGKRSAAIKNDIAVRRWSPGTQYRGFGSYPRNPERAGDLRWAFYNRAFEFDPYAVQMGTSYGLGQIMGFNHRRVGYDTPGAMIEAFEQHEDNQLLAAAVFIASDRQLKQAFIHHDFQVIEHKYNGGGQGGRYAADLEMLYNNIKSGGNHTSELFAGVSRAVSLRLGSYGEEVKALQKKLNSLGYICDADGMFGQRTEDQVILFQRHNGLSEDGIVGPKTQAAFDHAEPIEANRKPAHDIVLNTGQGNAGVGNLVLGGGATGLGLTKALSEPSASAPVPVSLETVVDQAERAERLVNITPRLIEFMTHYGLVVLGAGVVCFGAYQLYRLVSDYRARRWTSK